MFQGTVPAVSITNSGTGTVYVAGVSASMAVNLSGIGNAAIDAASGEGRLLGMCVHTQTLCEAMMLPWGNHSIMLLSILQSLPACNRTVANALLLQFLMRMM